MTTNAWVDWSKLPPDVARSIYKDAISGPGSFDWMKNRYAWAYTRYGPGYHYPRFDSAFDTSTDTWRNELRGQRLATDWSRRKFGVPVGEEFHPDANRATPMERLRYTALLGGAAVTAARAWWQPVSKSQDPMKDHVPHQTKSSQAQTLITGPYYAARQQTPRNF